MIIPTWEHCEAKFKEGVATPVEEFIYNNEPANPEDAFKFRIEFGAALRQAAQETYDIVA